MSVALKEISFNCVINMKFYSPAQIDARCVCHCQAYLTGRPTNIEMLEVAVDKSGLECTGCYLARSI